MKKSIVITGGTSGIGLASADYLLKKGYSVIITGRNTSNLNAALQQLGKNATGYVSATSSLKDIEDLVHNVSSKFGKIDGLFINAGIFKGANFLETSEALFDATMNINFRGAFFTIQKFVPILKNPYSIVLNTSIVVFKTFINTSAYTASKAALESISKVLNLELVEKGIRINIVSPGVTRTPILGKSGMSEEAVSSLMINIAKTSPLRRAVIPKDIAGVVEFLISDRSIALRNEKIVVDGGTTL